MRQWTTRTRACERTAHYPQCPHHSLTPDNFVASPVKLLLLTEAPGPLTSLTWATQAPALSWPGSLWRPQEWAQKEAVWETRFSNAKQIQAKTPYQAVSNTKNFWGQLDKVFPFYLPNPWAKPSWERLQSMWPCLSWTRMRKDLWVCLPPTLATIYVYFILKPTKVCIYGNYSYAGSAWSLN